jgi:hypothetical protein
VLISGTPEKTTDSGIIDKRGLLNYKNYLKMITENESNQIKNEQSKKDLQKNRSTLTLLALARLHKKRDQAFAKQQEAQREKK